jgi:hypothetical protein
MSEIDNARDAVKAIRPAITMFDAINQAHAAYVEAMATAIISWLESGDGIVRDSLTDDPVFDAVSTWLALFTDNVTFYDVLGLVDEHFA